MKTEEAAWLACAVDGEGWIGLYRVKGRKYEWDAVEVGISNTNIPFLQKAMDIIGKEHCLIADNHNSKKSWGYKVVYRLSVHKYAQVLRVLKEVVDFLVIKKEKALVVIKCIEEKKWGQKNSQTMMKRAETMRRLAAQRPKVVCSICGGEHVAKGLCSKHYQQIRRKPLCVS
ncbi:hypothetical protein LCGC14_1957290 [marine sediment metagenome]|uniref:Homing endonuclease LAGLIDADG domain-containing protein n=1 Tax=marine sediment metagenome TaxID=412755 RepID=A0A0F9ICQ7_9ZZZZ